MDENIGNNTENNDQNIDNNNHVTNTENIQQPNNIDNTTSISDNNSINNISRIGMDRNGAASLATSPRTLLILGWISAALTAFISPFFAIVGVALGVFANRHAKDSGNVVIITNIVLAAINILFGLFLIVAVRRAIFGY